MGWEVNRLARGLERCHDTVDQVRLRKAYVETARAQVGDQEECSLTISGDDPFSKWAQNTPIVYYQHQKAGEKTCDMSSAAG